MEFWQEAKKESLTDVKRMVTKYGLDPKVLNYSRTEVITPLSYHPLHRKNVNAVNYSINTPIYTVSFQNELKETKKNYVSVKKHLAKHKAGKRFQKDVKDVFNSFKLDVCIIWSNEALKAIHKTDNLKTINKWYSHIKGENIYPIDKKYFCLFDLKEEYKKLQNHCEKLLKIGNIVHYKVRPIYDFIHFLPEEWGELKSLPIKVEGVYGADENEVSSLMLGQARTIVKELKDNPLTEITLNSTGRKIKYNFNASPYCFESLHVDPILTGTVNGELKLNEPKRKF